MFIGWQCETFKKDNKLPVILANYSDQPAITPNGGLVREFPQNSLNSSLGVIVFVGPELCYDMESSN